MTHREKVQDLINSMTVEQMQEHLAEYMMNDERLMPRPIGVEVRLRETFDSSCRYDVLLLMDNGEEKEVKFRDRYSRLVYIYTLMNPKGYRRGMLKNNNYKALRQLYSLLYFAPSEPLIKSIGNDYDHFFSQAVAQSRVAIRHAYPCTKDFEIANPKQHLSKTVIPAASTVTIILDNSLQ